MVLWNTEVEWVALSEAVKEVMFMIQLLGNMKLSVKLPVMLRVVNIGAIFMASNFTTASHTKHVDIRNKYMNEYVDDGLVKIIFVWSTENDSNILKKT